MRPANLLPPDLAREGGKSLPGGAVVALGTGAAVGALLAGGFVLEHGKVSKREDQLAALKVQLASIPAPKPSTVVQQPGVAAERDARQTALDQALAQRVSWDTVLRELSLVLPEDVWLKTMTATASVTDPAVAATAPGAGSTGLVMSGFTYSQEGVARLLTRLALVPHLANVQLQSSSSSQVGTRKIVAFAVSADIIATGGTS
jgi:Tfp pilus assembly protein PilN